MTSSSKRDPVLVVIELAGGNDSLNSVVPYGDPLYMDNRVALRITPEEVLPINDHIGFHPAMGAMKGLYDEGKVAVIQGIGYPNHTLSHFRSMDIWHTCSPDKVSAEGWLGRTMRELDPNADNVLTGVNFGRGLSKALVSPGVPVASVGNLETYGVLTGIQDQDQRSEALEVFAQMYTPSMGRDMVGEYISQTGMDALKGADILSTALDKYSSTVEYANNEVAQYMKNIAQVHLADLGTRILYTTNPYNAFDTHAKQMEVHAREWERVANAVGDFYQDLKEHNASQDVVILLFSEFGRRVKENGSGTDHGAGGVAFVVGDAVKGGLYGEYPSLEWGKLMEGDLQFNNDFRGMYATVLEKWMGMDSTSIVKGSFEQFDFIR